MLPVEASGEAINGTKKGDEECDDERGVDAVFHDVG